MSDCNQFTDKLNIYIYIRKALRLLTDIYYFAQKIRNRELLQIVRNSRHAQAIMIFFTSEAFDDNIFLLLIRS